MSWLGTFAVLGLGLTAGAAGHYLYVHPPLEVMTLLSAWHGTAPAAERKSSITAIRAAHLIGLQRPSRMEMAATTFPSMTTRSHPSILRPRSNLRPPASTDERKVLYYRNPMGAPDTSPVPKKDPMGMDYIPVYADEQRPTPAPSR